MLFLVTSELKQLPPFLPQQVKEIMIEGWEKVIDYQKQGKILAQGMFAGRKGGCVIWDVESVEELHTLLSQSPIFPFLETEITPLISIEKALESIKLVQKIEQTSKE